MNKVISNTFTVSAVKEGKDAYILDLTNQMDSVPVDANGNVTFATTISTVARIIKGSDYVHDDIGIPQASSMKIGDVTPTVVSNGGLVTIEWKFTTSHKLSSSRYSVTVQMIHDGNTYSADFSLIVDKSGAIYQLLPSKSDIPFVRDAENNLIPAQQNIYCGYTKNQNGTITSFNGMSSSHLQGIDGKYNIFYRTVTSSGSYSTWSWMKDLSGFVIVVNGNSDVSAYEFVLSSATTNSDVADSNIIDRETVPVIRQSEKGYGIVTSITKNDLTESQWNTYGEIGHTETWADTESLRNNARVGDMFLVVGNATDTGSGHTLTYRCTNSSGNLSGVCIAHQISRGAERMATVMLYKRSASVLPSTNKPTGVLTYKFSTGKLTGTAAYFNGWSQDIPPSNGNPLYVTAATAYSMTDTDTVSPNEWSSPVLYNTDGMSNASVFLYKRSSTAPTVPSDSLTYTFSTGVLSGNLGGWSQEVPDTNGTPCWITQASAINTGATDTIAASEWSDPQRYVMDGESSFVADLTNEADLFGTDSNGRTIGTQVRTTNIHLLLGTKLQTLTENPSVSIAYASGGAVPSTVAKATVSGRDTTDGIVSVAIYSGQTIKDNIYVDITAICSSGAKTARFTLKPLSSGEEGKSPELWQLSMSHDAASFSRNDDNTLSPENISIKACATKTIGNETTIYESSQEGWRVYFGYDEGTSQNYMNIGGSLILGNTIAMSHTQVWFELRNSSDGYRKWYDRETIPIIKDGKKGDKGDDSEFLKVEVNNTTSALVRKTVLNNGTTYAPATAVFKVIKIVGDKREELNSLPTGYYMICTRVSDTSTAPSSKITTIPYTIVTGTLFNPSYTYARMDLYDNNDQIIASAYISTVEDGQDGDDGNGIDSVNIYRMFTFVFSSPSVSDSGWIPETSSSYPTEEQLSDEKRYLWQKKVTKYTKTLDVTNEISLVSQLDDGVHPNLLEDTAFNSVAEMDAWDVKSKYYPVSGQSASAEGGAGVVTQGTQGMNAYYDKTAYPSTILNYKDVLRQTVYNAGLNGIKKIEANKWYTLSFWVKGGTSAKLSTYIYPSCVNTGSDLYVDGVKRTANSDGRVDWECTSSWTRHYVTFRTLSNLTADGYVLFRLSPNGSTSNEVYICMPKLENNTIATAWIENVNDRMSDDIQHQYAGDWVAGTTYYYGGGTGIRHVVRALEQLGGKKIYWRMKQRTTSEGYVSTIQPYNDTEHWEKANYLKFIATDFILADEAIINLAQTNRILVVKSDGVTVAAGMGGAPNGDDDFPLWVGATFENRANAKFRVTLTGKLYAEDGEFTGYIHAKKGVFEDNLTSYNNMVGIVDSPSYRGMTWRGLVIGSNVTGSNASYDLARIGARYSTTSGIQGYGVIALRKYGADSDEIIELRGDDCSIRSRFVMSANVISYRATFLTADGSLSASSFNIKNSSLFVIDVTANTSVTLPTATQIMNDIKAGTDIDTVTFGSTVAVPITIVIKETSTATLTLNNVYNFNGSTQNLALTKGDVVTVMGTRNNVSNGWIWKLLHYNN